MAMTIIVLWLLMRGYHGLVGDAQIYAFQAIARIYPWLTTDLYLQNTSQDQFTVFSPFYSVFIGWFGLENAARLLSILFTAWLLCAAWILAARLGTRSAAWLSVGLLLIVPGNYGAAGVFHLAENFLSARLPAEAMVVTALACFAFGLKRLSLCLAIAALFVHPLMALPGLIIVVCMSLPIRAGLIAAIAGLVAVLGFAIFAASHALAAPIATLMDTDWLQVVRERSQFLFPQFWSVRDWDTNARSLLFLAFIAGTIEEGTRRNFCIAAMIIGASGLAVAVIADRIGPVAVLVQGQAWRWLWMACFAALLLLPIAMLQIWNQEKCGTLCTVLLISGLVVDSPVGTVCVLLAWLVWALRSRMGDRWRSYSRWLALVCSIALISWTSIKSTNSEFITNSNRGELIGVQLSAIVSGGAMWFWLGSAKSIRAPLIASMLLLAASIWLVPVSFKQSRSFGSTSSFQEFASWSHAIPAASTVLVAPTQDVGAFVWFTLQRPNYLALDQSAGVVFSRSTALEVRRRSDVVLPLTDPTWKILSGFQGKAASNGKIDAPTRALTAQSLIQVCSDPLLGFVISPVDIGIESIRHTHDGPWRGWNLYDCARVRH